jgi:hypothetical protein
MSRRAGIDLHARTRRGGAISILSQGADAVYLFNYFQTDLWPQPVYKNTLKAMASLDSLLKQPRCVGITYRDITAPGEKYQAPLPATGKEVEFSIRHGPIPGNRRTCELLVGFAPSVSCRLHVDTIVSQDLVGLELAAGILGRTNSTNGYCLKGLISPA